MRCYLRATTMAKAKGFDFRIKAFVAVRRGRVAGAK